MEITPCKGLAPWQVLGNVVVVFVVAVVVVAAALVVSAPVVSALESRS